MLSLEKNIDIALKTKKADLVLKNGFIINVFTQDIEKGDIAISDGIIAGIGDYSGEEEIDCSGYFISPGFIDSHVHIESSKLIPENYSKVLINRGITVCIADPHEIANVYGTEGIKFMIENGRRGPIDILYMIPSSVPAVEFDDNGAVLRSEDLVQFIGNESVLGLGEVMNVQGMLSKDKDTLKKLRLLNSANMPIDGHAPQIFSIDLNAYTSCRIRTDHESVDIDEALTKIMRGMYILIRHGTSAKNLKSLIPAVNENNYNRFCFCTDDKDVVDLMQKGTIDYNIKLAINMGLDPIKAITLATLNAAQCYGLMWRGAVAPGYRADLVIFDNLKDINVKQVIKDGKLYKDVGETNIKINLPPSMNINYINEEIFKLKAKSKKINVIQAISRSLITKKVVKEIEAKDGYVERVYPGNVLKIGVFERHKNTGRYSIGYVEGLEIKELSIAQSIAHDSHNIIVVGDNDKDMTTAVNALIARGGGIVVVSKGEVIGDLSLPIAGLMSCEDPKIVSRKVEELYRIVKEHGDKNNIFLSLSFLSLPVIPELKITTRGLYNVVENKFMDLFDVGEYA